MAPRPRIPWTLVVRALVALAAIAFLARGVCWPDLVAASRHAGLWVPVALTGMNACMMGLRALRVRVLLGARLSFTESFRTLLVSSALNNITPLRGGNVARLWLLARAAAVAPSAVVGVTMVENLVEAAVLAVLGLLASLRVGQRWASVASPVMFLASFGLLWLLRRGSRGPATMATGTPRPWPRWLARWRDRLRPGLAALSTPALPAYAASLSLLAWLCEAAMIALCARALGLSIGFPLAVLVLLGINLALAVPSTPAAAGAFESAAAAVLVLAGYAKGPAVAFALFYHALQVVPVTLVGASVLLLSRRGKRRAQVTLCATSSAKARDEVNPGESIPYRLSSPGTP